MNSTVRFIFNKNFVKKKVGEFYKQYTKPTTDHFSCILTFTV